MIDPAFERRVIMWAASCRDTKRKRKGATAVFCDSLAYLYGEAEPMLDEDGKPIATIPKEEQPQTEKIDLKDAALFDRAYRDERMSALMKKIIRLHYCYGASPRKVEDYCHLARRSFRMNLEISLGVFQKIVQEEEQKLDK